MRSLANGERNLTELAAPLKMSFPAASKHVRVLEQAQLVRRRLVGRTHICSINAKPLAQVTEWLENYRRNWESNFERLDDLLTEMKTRDSAQKPNRTDVDRKKEPQ